MISTWEICIHKILLYTVYSQLMCHPIFFFRAWFYSFITVTFISSQALEESPTAFDNHVFVLFF